MSENKNGSVQYINPEEKVSCCPVCEYRDGFHVSLYTRDVNAKSEVLLICPNCHNQFNLGWKVDLETSKSKL